MKLLCCLLLLAALSAPPAGPGLTAHWTRPGQAVVSWQQPPGIRLACAYRNATLLRCWQGLSAGRMAIALGGAGTDAQYRPAVGDVYRLWLDGVEARAGLEGRIYLPLIR